ncbi:IclR family transcriptional regulator [Mesorhizobium sp. B4-1-4]|uniref:IclR family transcriptional regulator n=1 Tax=Mesorhizobium sp. B4-1-4 TaxID=2589888 RepID=UPI0011287837|nr:IclR family transcriptional regulator [Mesorhizobium sp. B4-1-4]UCI31965.1 IclR family transcriptional regulator [Mesorhizobium sp. B4-1-4]
MTVKQIENAIALLEYFADRKRPATMADVAEHFGWPRSSTFHILTTLARIGYLYEPRIREGFYPTPRWLQLVSAIAEAEPIPEGLLRIMRGLADRTGETVWISAASGQYAVFLDVIESEAPVRYAAKPGKRVPIHLTASGLALLSQLDERDREIILRKATFEDRGPNAPTNLDEVRAELTAGRQRGWFRSASYYSPDLGGVSVPVMLSDRLFAMTIAGPLFRVEALFDRFASAIYETIATEYGSDCSNTTLENVRQSGDAKRNP